MGLFRRKKPKFKRSFKNILINPKLQLTVIGYFSFIAAMAIGYYFFNTTKRYSSISDIIYRIEDLPPDHIIFTLIEEHMIMMKLEFLAFALTFFFLFFLGGLILSHRIAGPIYHMRMHLRRTGKNKEFRHVHFRDGDFFFELADDFNDYVDHVAPTGNKPSSASSDTPPPPPPIPGG